MAQHWSPIIFWNTLTVNIIPRFVEHWDDHDVDKNRLPIMVHYSPPRIMLKLQNLGHLLDSQKKLGLKIEFEKSLISRLF